jgi:hypothetical protein
MEGEIAMKVRNMESLKGNPVPNQFILWGDNGETIFQSYSTTIAVKKNGEITLDKCYWNYSPTTSKYRSRFLQESTAKTKEKIKAGIYTLTDLNKGEE